MPDLDNLAVSGPSTTSHHDATSSVERFRTRMGHLPRSPLYLSLANASSSPDKCLANSVHPTRHSIAGPSGLLALPPRRQRERSSVAPNYRPPEYREIATGSGRSAQVTANVPSALQQRQSHPTGGAPEVVTTAAVTDSPIRVPASNFIASVRALDSSEIHPIAPALRRSELVRHDRSRSSDSLSYLTALPVVDDDDIYFRQPSLSQYNTSSSEFSEFRGSHQGNPSEQPRRFRESLSSESVRSPGLPELPSETFPISRPLSSRVPHMIPSSPPTTTFRRISIYDTHPSMRTPERRPATPVSPPDTPQTPFGPQRTPHTPGHPMQVYDDSLPSISQPQTPIGLPRRGIPPMSMAGSYTAPPPRWRGDARRGPDLPMYLRTPARGMAGMVYPSGVSCHQTYAFYAEHDYYGRPTRLESRADQENAVEEEVEERRGRDRRPRGRARSGNAEGMLDDTPPRELSRGR